MHVAYWLSTRKIRPRIIFIAWTLSLVWVISRIKFSIKNRDRQVKTVFMCKVPNRRLTVQNSRGTHDVTSYRGSIRKYKGMTWNYISRYHINRPISSNKSRIIISILITITKRFYLRRASSEWIIYSMQHASTLFGIRKDKKGTYGFRWSKRGIPQVWSSWAWLLSKWPSSGRECSCLQCPSCTLGPLESTRSSHNLYTRQLSPGKRRAHSLRHRKILRSWVLKQK